MSDQPLTVTREAIVAAARCWIGTPYHHQASVLGAGADCLGLVRGVWRELYGGEVDVARRYSRDWGEANAVEMMLDGARRHMCEVPPAAALPGDLLIYRMTRGAAAKHAAILATPHTMVHAVEGVAACEVAMCGWWHRHLAGVFVFPGV